VQQLDFGIAAKSAAQACSTPDALADAIIEVVKKIRGLLRVPQAGASRAPRTPEVAGNG
jgi:hypothetical protein